MKAPEKGPGGRSSQPGSRCESLASVTRLLLRPLVSLLPQALSPLHPSRARMVGPGVMGPEHSLGGDAPELLYSPWCSHRHTHSHVHICRHMSRTHHANIHVCTHMYNSHKCTDSQIHSLLHVCAH